MINCIGCNVNYRESRAHKCDSCHHEFCAACVRPCAACNAMFCDLHDCYHQHFLQAGCAPTQKSKRARVVVDEEDSDDLPILRCSAPSMRIVQSASSLACTTSGGLRVELADGIDNFALLNDAVADAFTPGGGMSRLQRRSVPVIEQLGDDSSAAGRSPSPPAPRRSDRRRRIDCVYNGGFVVDEAADADNADDSSGDSYACRERRLQERVYSCRLVEGCVDLCDDSSASGDDDSDTEGSLSAFIVQDEDYEASLNEAERKLYAKHNSEVQEFMMQVRINYATAECDAFRIILYYLVRCVFDRQYSVRIETAVKTTLCMEYALMEGKVVRTMLNEPLYKAKAIMQSSVWRQCVLDVMHNYTAIDVRPTDECLLTRKERRQMEIGDCRICRRRGHPIAKCLVLYRPETSSVPHPNNALYDDVRALERCRYSWSSAGTDWVGDASVREYQLLCGEFCAERLLRYHQLVHFWLKCAWLCYDTLKTRGMSAKRTAELIRDGNEEPLERRCWAAYTRVLDRCDGYTPSRWAKSAYENNE